MLIHESGHHALHAAKAPAVPHANSRTENQQVPRAADGLISRGVVVQGNRTTMRLEPEFWNALEEVCRREGIGVSELIERAEGRIYRGSRTSAVRAYIVSYFRDKASETG